MFNRFQFQDILKPAYNTVDMIEVELTDDDQGPREFNNQLLNVSVIALRFFEMHYLFSIKNQTNNTILVVLLVQMRESIINQSTGAKWIRVKYHFDEMVRIFPIRTSNPQCSQSKTKLSPSKTPIHRNGYRVRSASTTGHRSRTPRSRWWSRIPRRTGSIGCRYARRTRSTVFTRKAATWPASSPVTIGKSIRIGK